MIKFGDIKYERPDYDKLRIRLQETIDVVNNSSDEKEISKAISEFCFLPITPSPGTILRF